MIGQTLAHYKILEKIGSGGMGDVYLAEDTKLDRKVALKVLPPELADNDERRARFQREAKAIAALDHPNIVQVFSVEEADGTHFITIQLVQGKTLTELLPKNGFSLNKFFDIAIPLADAVAAAHQEGITHRDLKPDNVMVSDDGRGRVLDFRLAKPVGGFTASERPTAAKTEEGVVVGTVAYMSPEQAQGKPVDARSDIFSLGILFFEMITSGLAVVAADGGEPKRLTSIGTARLWWPDGDWVGFVHAGHLWRVAAGGGEPEQLTRTNLLHERPRWSHDYKELHFTGGGEPSNLWSFSLDDGSERPLTDFEGRAGRVGMQPLATDGKYLFFTWERRRRRSLGH